MMWPFGLLGFSFFRHAWGALWGCREGWTPPLFRHNGTVIRRGSTRWARTPGWC